MKVEKQTLRSLLDSNTTYVMPLFQRGYIWSEENWQTLWDDILRTVEERQERQGGQHFIGAIVLQQLATVAGRMPQYQVIDGQQRVTTIQIILKALLDELAQRGQGESSQEDINGYIFNTGGKVKETSDQFKVWPTNGDRSSYVAIMNNQDITEPPNPQFSGAYVFFRSQVVQWLDDPGDTFDSVDEAVESFLYVIEEGLVLAEIDLEGDDDSQEIFETLNALGTPLGPADLIKNHLFRLAQSLEMDAEKLYETYWTVFDTHQQFWQEEVTVGRYKRPRIDIFFQYWVAVQLERDVTADIVFRSFRKLMENAGTDEIEATFSSIVRYAEMYVRLMQRQGTDRENHFVARLEEMETYAVYPLVFFFYDHVQNQNERHKVLDIIESFLVRRMLLRYTARSYARAGTDTIHALSTSGTITADSLADRLRGYEATGTKWPTDEEVRDGLTQFRMYGLIRQSRLSMVLLAVNAKMHAERSEVVDIDGSNLQIEHVMPQSWYEHWQLPPGNATETKNRRDALINTIGNLTVITGKLNQTVSNGDWDTKRSGLNEFSNLVINRELLKNATWDEEKIVERSKQIADYICEIWPR